MKQHLKKCTIHASGMFSLFSAIVFAERNFRVNKIVYFDHGKKFRNVEDFLSQIAPIITFFNLKRENFIYLRSVEEAILNKYDIYQIEDLDVVFAESLQSRQNQKLILDLDPKELHFYAEGAMSYGPIRGGLPNELKEMLQAVHFVAYNDLAPIVMLQYSCTSKAVTEIEFRQILEHFFKHLDEKYVDLTQINTFLNLVGSGGTAILHQNLSSISGFDVEDEKSIFCNLIENASLSLNNKLIIFMHPKSKLKKEEISENIEAPSDKIVYVFPSFPFSEYYIYKMGAKLCVGVFSTSLINANLLGIDVLTSGSFEVGNKITSAFDSNIYAIHYTQLCLGSFEHEGWLFPGVNLYDLQQRLRDNQRSRCEVKNEKLWKLPYYLGDRKLLLNNVRQVKEDLFSLETFQRMPAFRRLSAGRREIIQTSELGLWQRKLRTLHATLNKLKFFLRLSKK